MIRLALEELGHKQPKTPLKTDNSTAANFANSSLRQKRSKAWDMCYHWLRDRVSQNQYNIFWEAGKSNEADFTTKHHNPGYHMQMRQRYLHKIHLIHHYLHSLV